MSPERAWRALFVRTPGAEVMWLWTGTVYAHVDGLREFPVVSTVSLVTYLTVSVDPRGSVLEWHSIGFFGSVADGEATRVWDNPFTGRRQELPGCVREGPGSYEVAAAADGDVRIARTAANAQTNRVALSLTPGEHRSRLVLVEGTLQGFPTLLGDLPDLADPAVTERQTRLELVVPGPTAAPKLAGSSGFFSHVYDALPSWLGFGDRLGNVVVKGAVTPVAAGASSRALRDLAAVSGGKA